jgi:hypothetical protein
MTGGTTLAGIPLARDPFPITAPALSKSRAYRTVRVAAHSEDIKIIQRAIKKDKAEFV